MKQTDEFSGFHPIVNFIYFALIIGFSMVFMHPVMLFISLITGITYHRSAEILFTVVFTYNDY